MSLRTSCVAVLALMGLGMMAAPASANLIVNGDFQTGLTTGWQILQPGLTVVADAGPRGIGDYALRVQSTVGWTSVAIANNGDPLGDIGTTYTVSFDVRVDPTKGNDTSLYTQGAWGGPSYPDYNFATNAAALADGSWHTESFSLTPTGVGGPFRLGIYENGGSRDIYLDNIQVSVPEPTSMALLGLAGVALLHRRRA